MRLGKDSCEKIDPPHPTRALQGMRAGLSQTASLGCLGSTVIGVLSKYSDRLNTRCPRWPREQPSQECSQCSPLRVAARLVNHPTGRRARLEILSLGLVHYPVC